MEGKKNVVVVDICHTLYNSNTTYDFFKFCIKTGKLPVLTKLYFKVLLSKLSPIYWVVAVNEKIFKKDVFKFLTVRTLRGYNIHLVETWADEFYLKYLIHRSIAPTMSIIQKFDSSDLILISATLQPIAKSIAKHLAIKNFIATQLEIKNEKYTGQILNDLSGRKLEALYTFKKEHVSIDVVITDNFTDKSLMATADQKYAVCYNKKQEKFWSSLSKVNILQVKLL